MEKITTYNTNINIDEQLLPIELNKNQEPVVSGRILHEFLEIETPYTKWFSRMREYGFLEDTDFVLVGQKSPTNNPKNPFTEITDHALKLDMAKEISMLQRNEKGKLARQYFIEAEKKLREQQNQKLMPKGRELFALAILEANKVIEEQTELLDRQSKILEEQEPDVKFAKAILSSKSCISINGFSKVLYQNGLDIGEKRLFAWLRDNSYLQKSGRDKNLPMQRSMDMKLFEIDKSAYTVAKIVFTSTRTMVTPKGQKYFINKLLNEEVEQLTLKY